MTLRLHNTLSGGVERFVPLRDVSVTFYSCGPTVYDFAHIGNFRTFLTSDLLRRWLESPLCRRVSASGEDEDDPIASLDEAVAERLLASKSGPFTRPEGLAGGYSVDHVMNITDVGHMTADDAADGSGEDKMAAARERLLESKKSGKLPPGAPSDLDPNNPHDIAAFYADAFIADAKALGIRAVLEANTQERAAHHLPRASHAVPEMLAMIVGLVDKGFAYMSGDACYFDTQRFPEYGGLSGNTLDEIRSGAGGRVSQENQRAKRHPADFMLWKADEKHLMRWDPAEALSRTPALAARAAELGLGTGYPGWHIECSAMARERLGDVIDIHSGGEDLIFPHHECEIAQSRCSTGADAFARYWLHVRFLRVDGAKMSKSAGNFYTARQVLSRGFTPGALRLALMSSHYRQNANFTAEGLSAAESVVARWARFIEAGLGSEAEGRADTDAADRFAKALNDDLNVAEAIAVINAWSRSVSEPTRADAGLMMLFDDVFAVASMRRAEHEGEHGVRSTGDNDASHIDELIQRRAAARNVRDFTEADRIRDELDGLGVELIDGPEGTTWKRRAEL